MTWIDVKVKKPKRGERVILCDRNKTICLGLLSKKGAYCTENLWVLTHVTHWMKLPEPPE